MQIEILYEDDNLLAINKPSGLKVHGDGRTSDETLADWVLEKYPALKDVGEPGVLSDGRAIARPGIVHRIDAETSGVLVLVKNQETFLHLKNQFKDKALAVFVMPPSIQHLEERLKSRETETPESIARRIGKA